MAKRNYYEEIIEKGARLPYGIDREDVKKAQEFNFIGYLRENYSSVLLEEWKFILNEAKSFRLDIYNTLPPFKRALDNLAGALYATIAIPVYSLFLMLAESTNIIATLAEYPKEKKRKEELLDMVSKYL